MVSHGLLHGREPDELKKWEKQKQTLKPLADELGNAGVVVSVYFVCYTEWLRHHKSVLEFFENDIAHDKNRVKLMENLSEFKNLVYQDIKNSIANLHPMPTPEKTTTSTTTTTTSATTTSTKTTPSTSTSSSTTSTATSTISTSTTTTMKAVTKADISTEKAIEQTSSTSATISTESSISQEQSTVPKTRTTEQISETGSTTIDVSTEKSSESSTNVMTSNPNGTTVNAAIGQSPEANEETGGFPAWVIAVIICVVVLLIILVIVVAVVVTRRKKAAAKIAKEKALQETMAKKKAEEEKLARRKTSLKKADEKTMPTMKKPDGKKIPIMAKSSSIHDRPNPGGKSISMAFGAGGASHRMRVSLRDENQIKPNSSVSSATKKSSVLKKKVAWGKK